MTQMATIDSPTAVGAITEGVGMVPTSSIAPLGTNPRTKIDPDALTELTDSVLKYGLLEPLVVRRAPEGHPSGAKWQLLAGERRWRAAIDAELEEVPVRIVVCSDLQALAIALEENLQRKDLDPLERAGGFKRLAEAGMSQAEIGQRFGMSQAAVSNQLRLLSLPEEIQERIGQGVLSASHGIALAGLSDDVVAQYQMAARAVNESWPQKRLESEIAEFRRQEEARKAQVALPDTPVGTIPTPRSGSATSEAADSEDEESDESDDEEAEEEYSARNESPVGAVTPESAVKTPESAVKTPESAVKTPESAVKTPESPSITPESPSITPESPSITPESPSITPESSPVAAKPSPTVPAPTGPIPPKVGTAAAHPPTPAAHPPTPATPAPPPTPPPTPPAFIQCLLPAALHEWLMSQALPLKTAIETLRRIADLAMLNGSTLSAWVDELEERTDHV